MDDRAFGKRQPDQGQVHLIERHLVRNELCSGRRLEPLVSLCKIKVSKQRDNVTPVGDAGRCDILRKSRFRQKFLGKGTQVLDKRQFTTRLDRGMRSKNTFDECRTRTRRADNEERLRCSRPAGCFRQPAHRFAVESLPQFAEEHLHRNGIVAESAGLDRQRSLGFCEVLPGTVEIADAVLDKATLQQSITVQLTAPIDRRKRTFVVAGSRLKSRYEQINTAGLHGHRLVEEGLCLVDFAADFVELRPVRDGAHICGLQLMSLPIQFTSFVGSFLPGQVEREIRQHLTVRTTDIERVAKVPFAGRQLVEFREDGAQVRVCGSIVGMQFDGPPQYGFGFVYVARQEIQIAQFGGGPVDQRVDIQDHFEDPGGVRGVVLGPVCPVTDRESINVIFVTMQEFDREPQCFFRCAGFKCAVAFFDRGGRHCRVERCS